MIFSCNKISTSGVLKASKREPVISLAVFFNSVHTPTLTDSSLDEYLLLKKINNKSIIKPIEYRRLLKH